MGKNYGVSGVTQPNSVAIDRTNGDIVVAGYFYGTEDFGGGQITSSGSFGNNAAAFVAKFDATGNYRWAKRFDNGVNVVAQGLAIDASGRITVGGGFQGSISFGGNTLTAVGNGFDLFLAQFDAQGNHLWSEIVGQGNITALAEDPLGNILIAGRAYSPDPGVAPVDGFYLAKFSRTGPILWNESFGGETTQTGPWLAVDPSGNAVMAGAFNSGTPVNFGGGPMSANGGVDAFVAKFDAMGAYQWGKQYGDSDNQEADGVATDVCGNIYVAGHFDSSIDFGNNVALVASDITKDYTFLAKMDASSHAIWAKEFFDSNPSNPPANTFQFLNLALDVEGRPVVTASFNGQVDFGGGPLTSVLDPSSPGGTRPALAIASFDTNGAYRWALGGGSPSSADAYPAIFAAIASSPATTVMLGNFGREVCPPCLYSVPGTTLTLAGYTLVPNSADDMFLFTFSP
jgi:hypothetical protein